MIKKKVLKDALWKVYTYLQNVYGSEGDDFLTNSAIKFYSPKEIESIGKALKKEIRDIFNKK